MRVLILMGHINKQVNGMKLTLLRKNEDNLIIQLYLILKNTRELGTSSLPTFRQTASLSATKQCHRTSILHQV
jgi:hypothetical protein